MMSNPGIAYSSHWSAEENKDIYEDDVEGEGSRRNLRRPHWIDIAKDYFELTTSNYLIGWGEKIHFCRFVKPGETIDAAQCRHEHFLALMTGMKPGMRALDAGCGVGGPAREMARFAGIHVTGISINKQHVELATRFSKEEGLSELTDFIEGDFTHLPFPDNTFDIVYAIEATVYAPDLSSCYKELARVLKPGGIFGNYEWHLTQKFSPNNKHHVELRQRVERGDGLTNLVPIKEGLEAMGLAGFEILHNEDLAQRGDEIPWWYPLDADTSKTKCWKDRRRVFMLKRGVFRVMCKVAWFHEFVLRSSRKGKFEAIKTMGMSVYGQRDAAKEGIFTPMYLTVGRKLPKEHVEGDQAKVASLTTAPIAVEVKN